MTALVMTFMIATTALVSILAILVRRKSNAFLWIMACPLWVSLGMYFFNSITQTNHGMIFAIVLIAVGAYCLFKAGMILLE